MTRLLASGIALLAGVMLAPDTPRAQRRAPNVLVIVADDMGYADLGVHGSRDVKTPHIDALAAGGIRFTDAYVTGPYCSPTRAGLLTGRYPQRFGHEFNINLGPAFENAGLPLSQRTLPDRLRAAGYQTALFGKWHLGSSGKFHPMDRGFDEFFGFLGGAHSYHDVNENTANPLLDGRKPAARTTYLTDELTERAVAYLQRERSHRARAVHAARTEARGRHARDLLQRQRRPDYAGHDGQRREQRAAARIQAPDVRGRHPGAVRHPLEGTTRRRPGGLASGRPARRVSHGARLRRCGDRSGLAADLGETKNVAADHPAVVKDLADTWQRWNRELAQPLWMPGGRGRFFAGLSVEETARRSTARRAR